MLKEDWDSGTRWIKKGESPCGRSPEESRYINILLLLTLLTLLNVNLILK